MNLRKLAGALEELERGRQRSEHDVNTVPMYEILKNKKIKLKKLSMLYIWT